MPNDRIVAVGLLTQRELGRYGSGLKKVFPVQETPCFMELLQLIDQADREHWCEEDRLDALRRLRSSREDS
jgi:hypothetical protein